MQNSSFHSLKNWAFSLASVLLLAPSAAPRTALNRGEPVAMFFNSTGALTCRPNGLWFGKVQLGTSTSLSGALVNTGNANVTVSAINQSSRFFSVSGVTLPLTIAPGSRVPFTVTFTPEGLGRTDDSLGFVSDASTSVLYLTLHGVGYALGTLTPSPATLAFGNVLLGQTSTQSIVLTNSGRSGLTISQISASGGFTIGTLAFPFSLPAGQSLQLPVSFKAQSSGAIGGNVTVASDASDASLTIPLSATVPSAGTLQPVYPSLSFGAINVGGTSSKMETISNTGGSSVTVLQALISGAGFSLSGLPVPVTLSPGQSYTFPVTFTASAPSSISGNLTLTSDGSNTSLSIPLSGSGLAAGQISLLPGSLDFGNVTVGQTKSLGASLSASGADVTVSSATTTSNEFKLSGVSLPLTVPAGQSLTLSLLFTPAATGAATANLSLQSSAGNAVSQILSGYGLAAVKHSVALSWTQSGSNIAGFNVYRATVTGGPYTRLNSSTISGTNFTDSNVQPGTTYFYVTSAVSSTGSESKYSNQALATVPAQ
jgi:hypothetical protein